MKCALLLGRNPRTNAIRYQTGEVDRADRDICRERAITSYMRSSNVSLGLYAIVEPFVRAAFGA